MPGELIGGALDSTNDELALKLKELTRFTKSGVN